MKRVIIVLLAAAVLTVAAGTYLWQTIREEGGSDIEQWIASLIVRVLDQYVTPEIELDELDYQAPYKVNIAGLKLTAGQTAILAVDRASLELEERPHRGEPISIREIELQRPALRFIQGEDSEFVGWSGFIEPDVLSSPESVEPGQRLSDVLVLRHVGIHEGEIVYRTSDGQTMRLPGISVDLETPPVEDEPGWYRLIGRLVREPGFVLDFDGRVNLDERILECNDVALKAELGPEVYETIPPPLQGILARHEVEGTLVVTLTGRCPLMDPTSSEIDMELTLTDGLIVFEENVLPAKRLHVQARLAEGRATVHYAGDLLGGNISGDATLSVTAPMNMVANWIMRGIQIEKTLRVTQEEEPRYAGRMGGRGRITADLASFLETLGGEGQLVVREGKLARLPVIFSILDVAEGMNVLADATRKDEADVTFNLHPDRATFTRLELKTGPAVIRGTGDVLFNMTLDLEMQVGAVEGLTDRLGGIGRVLRRVNDQLVTYDVTGRVNQPKVTPRPLNIRLP